MGKPRIRVEDYIGLKYNELTIIEYAGKSEKDNRKLVKCKCDCGNDVVVPLICVKNGNTKSCGCRQKRKVCERNHKHGHVNERLYIVWNGMKRRCNSTKGQDARDYHNRGIKVCTEWLDYMTFRKWAYANGYDENAEFGKCTIDRINPNGDYEPSNCRWVDENIQARNKRNNINIEYNGETHCLKDWVRITGIKRETLKQRYHAGKRGDALFSKKNLRTGDDLS